MNEQKPLEPWQWPEEHWRKLVNQVRAGRPLRPKRWKNGARCAFAISFDNFTLSLFLTSAKLTPLPIELFAYLKYSFDPTAAAVSAFAIGVALVLVLGIARFTGLEEFTGF